VFQSGHFKYWTVTILFLLFVGGSIYSHTLGSPFRKPLGVDVDRMQVLLANVATDVKEEDWETAFATASEAFTWFEKVRPRLALIADKHEIDEFERDLHELIAAVEIKKDDAFFMVAGLKSQWRQLAGP